MIFRTVLGVGQGNSVVNLAKAKEVLYDTRIKAGERVSNIMHLGVAPEKGQTIQALLLYRGMPQKILNLVPGKPLGPLPVVEMAKITKSL